MNDKMLEIISILNGTADDIDKIENKKYGYKSSAVRARKACQEAINMLKCIMPAKLFELFRAIICCSLSCQQHVLLLCAGKAIL